jgi:hypothetical protein
MIVATTSTRASSVCSRAIDSGHCAAIQLAARLVASTPPTSVRPPLPISEQRILQGLSVRIVYDVETWPPQQVWPRAGDVPTDSATQGDEWIQDAVFLIRSRTCDEGLRQRRQPPRCVRSLGIATPEVQRRDNSPGRGTSGGVTPLRGFLAASALWLLPAVECRPSAPSILCREPR